VIRIVSLNIGRPKELAHGPETVHQSAIARTPVAAALELGLVGFKGDQVADTKHHGGPDKAVNVYALEHYAHWEDRLGRTLTHPSFGENFTVAGLLETDVCIGDTFRVGSSVVQVSQPRVPCFKPAALHHEPRLTKWIEDSGFTGWYFRVLEPGLVAPGDELVRLEPSKHGVSITEANRIMHRDQYDRAGLEKLLSIPELALAWRRPLQMRLGKIRKSENPQ
jgi:MOSC domain-containing protein YiiM